MNIKSLESLPKDFTFVKKVKKFLFPETEELKKLKVPWQVKRKVFLEAKKGIVLWFEDFLFVCEKLIAVILKRHLNDEPEKLSFLFASFFDEFMKEVQAEVVIVIEGESSTLECIYNGYGVVEFLIKSFFYPKNKAQVSLKAFGKMLKKLGEKKLSILYHYDEVRKVYEMELKEVKEMTV